jgi:hypothetical protein
VAVSFLQGVVALARQRKLLSEEHFTVDGTLLEAWASQKSFRPKNTAGDADPPAGRNEARDFRGEKRATKPMRPPRIRTPGSLARRGRKLGSATARAC